MLYLYHATHRKNLDFILNEGLLADPPMHNNWGYAIFTDGVYLCFNARDAENWVYDIFDDIIVLKIPYGALAEEYFQYDSNVGWDSLDDIDDCVYTLSIPPECIEVVDNIYAEPQQSFEDFWGTLLYNIIVEGFEAEMGG